MIVAYESVDIEKVIPDHSMARELNAVRLAEMPAFVIRAAITEQQQILSDLSAAAGSIGFVETIPERDTGTETDIGDLGLHVDTKSTFEETGETSISISWMRAGRLEADFFEVLSVESFIPVAPHLPATIFDHYRNGQVDDEVFSPIRYTAKLRNGDLLVARVAGIRFLAHNYKSLTTIRRSKQSAMLHSTKQKDLKEVE